MNNDWDDDEFDDEEAGGNNESMARPRVAAPAAVAPPPQSDATKKLERPPKVKPDQRPASLPDDAWWDDTEGYWVVGRKDAQGLLNGLITSYWSDGVLCARIEREAGKPHGKAIRYHTSGDIAQTFEMVHGTFHGVRTWYYTDEPSYEVERPSVLSRLVTRVENEYDMGRVVEQRYFDAEGRRVDYRGEPMS